MATDLAFGGWIRLYFHVHFVIYEIVHVVSDKGLLCNVPKQEFH